MKRFFVRGVLCALVLAGMSVQAMPLGVRTLMHAHAVARQSQKWTVTFDAQGGVLDAEVEDTIVLPDGIAIGVLPAPTRTGYMFDGWFTAAEDGELVDGETLVVGDMSLYAQWTANKYTVTFDAGSGTGGWSREMAYGSAIAAPIVVRTGYTFKDWIPDVAATVPDSNVTYVAQWQINKYAVTFDANGGVGGWSREMDYGTAIVAPVVTRTGYTFKGWSPTVAVSVPDNDVTYTAQWEIVKHTVTLVLNGGEGGGSAVVDYGTRVADIAVPTRTGYAFAGWFTAAEGGELVAYDTLVVGDMSLYAQWTADKHTVTFDANGGTGGWSREMDYGTAIVAPVVTRVGYTLVDWTPLVAATVPDEDVTYMAQWIVNKHVVTFDANGGIGGWGREMDYGSAIVAPVVTRTGYTFKGWTPAVAATVPDNDVAYTAQWEINRHTVTLVLNGGEGEGSVVVDYGTKVADIAVPTLTGHMFDGWFTAADGGELVDVETLVTGDMSLYAHWTANEHLVTFDVNGGGAVLADKTRTVKHGEPVGELPTPARSGYAFNGWYTASTGGTKISKSTKVMADTKFYAHWDQTYTITLELEGGKCDSSTVFAVKAGGSLPDRVVTRYGHAFQGFFTEPNGGGVQYYGSNGKGMKAWDRTEGATLYASWASDGKFTVVLHKNDGTGTEHAVSVESGKDAILPGGSDAVSKNGLAWAPRRGFSFMGWSLGEKDKTVAFADKANMKSSFTAGGMLDLYAVWQLDTASAYAIQYIRNDGSGSVRTVGFKCGVETNLNSANGLGFLRRGFDFLGWTLTTDDAKAVSAGSKEPWRQDMGTVAETTAGKLLKVYASWRLKEGYYAIKFYKNDVENPFAGKWRELGYEYGKNTTLPTVKVGFGWEREGYTFVGWATSKDNAKAGKIWRGDAGVTTVPVEPGKTLTLFAVWAKDSASVATAVCTGKGCASAGAAASEGKTVQTLVYFADGDSQPVEARIESDGFTVVELGGSAYCGYVSDGVGELLGPDGSILLVVIAVE